MALHFDGWKILRKPPNYTVTPIDDLMVAVDRDDDTIIFSFLIMFEFEMDLTLSDDEVSKFSREDLFNVFDDFLSVFHQEPVSVIRSNDYARGVVAILRDKLVYDLYFSIE